MKILFFILSIFYLAFSFPLGMSDGQVVRFKAKSNSSYVTVNDYNKLLFANDSIPEEYTLNDVGNGFLSIKSNRFNLFLSARYDLYNLVLAFTDSVGDWEKFTIQDLGNGEFALLAFSGQYVSADFAWGDPPLLVADKSSPGLWETFILEIVDDYEEKLVERTMLIWFFCGLVSSSLFACGAFFYKI